MSTRRMAISADSHPSPAYRRRLARDAALRLCLEGLEQRILLSGAPPIVKGVIGIVNKGYTLYCSDPAPTYFASRLNPGPHSIFTFNIRSSYFDPEGDPLHSIRIEMLPGGGTLYLTVDSRTTRVTEGQIIPADQIDGLSFRAPADCTGIATFFLWSASDGTSFSMRTGYTIQINDPDPQSFTLELQQNRPSRELSGTFSNCYRFDEIMFLSLPEHGTFYVTVDSVDIPIAVGDIITLDIARPIFYVPEPGYFGTESIEYTGSFGEGFREASGTVVLETWRVPILHPIEKTLESGQTLTFDPADLVEACRDDSLTFEMIRISSLPNRGTLTLVADSAEVPVSVDALLTVEQFGALKYTPNPGFQGSDELRWMPVLGPECRNVSGLLRLSVEPVAQTDPSTPAESTPLADSQKDSSVTDEPRAESSPPADAAPAPVIEESPAPDKDRAHNPPPESAPIEADYPPVSDPSSGEYLPVFIAPVVDTEPVRFDPPQSKAVPRNYAPPVGDGTETYLRIQPVDRQVYGTIPLRLTLSAAGYHMLLEAGAVVPGAAGNWDNRMEHGAASFGQSSGGVDSPAGFDAREARIESPIPQVFATVSLHNTGEDAPLHRFAATTDARSSVGTRTTIDETLLDSSIATAI